MSWWKPKKGKALKPSKINPWRVPMKKPCKAFYGDSDGDGVMNMFDCQPHNKRKQGTEHEGIDMSNWSEEEKAEARRAVKYGGRGMKPKRKYYQDDEGAVIITDEGLTIKGTKVFD